MNTNEKELPTTRTAQPRRQCQSCPPRHRPDDDDDDPRQLRRRPPEARLRPRTPPPSAGRGRPMPTPNNQYRAIHVRNQRSRTDDGGPNGIERPAPQRRRPASRCPPHREDRGGGGSRPAAQRQDEGKQSNIKRGTYLVLKLVVILQFVSPDGLTNCGASTSRAIFSTPKVPTEGTGEFFPGGQTSL